MIAVMVLWPERAVVSPGAMEVTAIDVGQGDSLLVVSPEGRTMLVDAGGPVGGCEGGGGGVRVGSMWARRWCRLICGRGGFGGWM